MNHKRLPPILLVCLFLTAMTLLLYWPVQNYDFVNYDDDIYVTDNRHVQGGLTLEGLKWSFVTCHTGNWHPLAWLSHMTDVEVYRFNAGGHHWTSVLIHAAGAVLLFLALSAMTGSPWTSALVSAFFAIHPLHVESVAWVAERKDVLSGFFWFLSMGAYAYYVRSPDCRRYFLVLLSFSLGLLSKPMVVTLPFVLLLLDYWPLQRFAGTGTAFDRWIFRGKTSSRVNAMRLVVEKVPLFFLAALSSIMTVVAQRGAHAIWTLDQISLDVRLANALVSYMDYIGKMFLPVDLAVLYPHAGMPPVWKFAAALSILVSISFFVARKIREFPFLLVGWLWYLGTLVPVIGLVQVGSQSMADRYTYLPLTGLFIAVAWGAKSIVEMPRARALKKPVIVLLCAAMAGQLILAKLQVETWKNSLTLFEHALSVTKVNPVAQHNIGAYYLGKNDCTKAIPYFLGAIEIRNDYADAFHNLGVCAYRDNNAEGAIQYFQQAVRMNPRFTKVRMDLGFLLMQMGSIEEAKEEYQQVLRMDHFDEVAHHHLGVIFLYQGRLGDAEAHLREAIRVNPRNAEALNNLGLVGMEQGRTDDAIANFLKARELMPGNAAIEANLRISCEKRQKDSLGKGSL